MNARQKMSEETEALFTAMFSLEDVREELRKTAPKHELDEEGKALVRKALEKARNALEVLEKWSR